jgi:ABC-type amino acid transport substrate-binding protein
VGSMRTRTGRWLATMVATSFLLIAAILAGGCGDDDDSSTGAGAGQPAAAQSEGLDLISDGTLTVGAEMVLPPFDYYEDGEPTGFDIEFISAVADKLGLEPKWVKNDWSTIFTALAAGKFDMVLSAATVTQERLAVVDFTNPYFRTSLALMTVADERPDIKDFDDLGEGDVIGVQKGGTELSWSEKHLAPRGVEIKQYAEFPSAVLDLEVGRVDGVVGDSSLSPPQLERHPGVDVTDLVSTGYSYAYAVQKGDTALLDAINGAMEELVQDGTYGEIWAEYFPDIPVPEELPELGKVPAS